MRTRQQDTHARSDSQITAADALRTSEQGGPLNVEQEIDESKAIIERPPIGCPRCGHELDAGPYGTWQCWHCRETLTVRGGRP